MIGSCYWCRKRTAFATCFIIENFCVCDNFFDFSISNRSIYSQSSFTKKYCFSSTQYPCRYTMFG